MQICVLKEIEMREIFSMSEGIQAAKDALRIYTAGGADIPLRVNIPIPDFTGESLYMPGYAKETKALGIKIVSVYPKNVDKGLTSVPATMILVNDETGEVCSIMDGTWLTRLRTGAVAGAATDILAREDARSGALIGTGGQAETQLEAMLTVRELAEVWVYDMDLDRCRIFCQRMQVKFVNRFSTKILPAATSDEAIEGADIITAVTTSKTPVFNGIKVKAGAHINGVGAFTPEMLELPEDAILQANPIAVDTLHGALHEAGDIIAALKMGVVQEAALVELGDIISGKVQGRASAEDITLFKTVGSSVLDVVTARRIYEKALIEKKGYILEF